jgi:hypothetical protein
MTMHANKHSVHPFVKDGGTTLFESTDFLDPGVLRFAAAFFYTFASGQITYQCDYSNPTTNVIFAGDSVATDETCIVFGFFFPSTRPALCFNNFLVP